MSAFMKLPQDTREVLLAEANRKTRAMADGPKEKIYDDKGEHIATTFHGDGTFLPETFYKTIVITPDDLKNN